jgi:GNAT superfamily N-acetyltransferase
MSPIIYLTSTEGIGPQHLQGFFDGWPHPPSPDRHLQILNGSSHVILAWDEEQARVIGFINALSDGGMMAFIPLLEVLQDHRNQGIGSELVRRMLERLQGHYSIDLMCDEHLSAFYQRFQMFQGFGMMLRNRSSLVSGETA